MRSPTASAPAPGGVRSSTAGSSAPFNNNGPLYSIDELSLMSGRLSAPNAPPKDPMEAAAHLLLIQEQMRHERRLLEREAKEVRRRREELAKDVKAWEGILSSTSPMVFYASQRGARATVALWRKGLPPQLRPAVWELALGNPLGIDDKVYAMCVVKARRRQEKASASTAATSSSNTTGRGASSASPSVPTASPLSPSPLCGSPSPSPSSANDAVGTANHNANGAAASGRDDPYSQLLGIASSVSVPEETSLRQAFSREAYKTQRRYTNDHILDGMAMQQHYGDASLSSAACVGGGVGGSCPSVSAGGNAKNAEGAPISMSFSSPAEGGGASAGEDAALALGTLSEDGATLREDNEEDCGEGGRRRGVAVASPRTHAKDNANAIAIDLHRTIITRSGRGAQPPPFTTIDGSASPRGAAAAVGGGRAGSPLPSGGGGGMGTSPPVGSSPCIGNMSFGYGMGGGVVSPPRALGGTPTTPTPADDLTSQSATPTATAADDGDGGSFTSLTMTPTGGSLPTPTAATSTTPTVAAHNNCTPNALLVRNMCEDASLLRRIGELLRTFVEYRPDIGYVQGMSYLAAMLLLHIECDQKALIALASLLAKGHLQYFYTVQHRGIGSHIAVFEAVLQKGLPRLHRHFQMIGVVPQMYVIDWWMSLFARTLPYEIAARCWDLFLLDEAYLYRISLSLLIYFGNIIHEDAPIDEILMFLSKIQHYTINEDRLFAIVADSSKYPPSIETIHKVMREHLAGLELPN